MSHETLRFNVILNKPGSQLQGPNALTHSTYDSIYSDSKYGTHFCTYANFIGLKTTSGFKVEKLNIKVQNYTGSVTIGISKFIGYTSEPLDQSLYVEGFSNHKNKHIKFYIMYQGFLKPTIKTIPKNDTDLRIAGLEFEQGDFLEVISFCEPIPNCLIDIDQDPNTMGEEALFADEEYVIRNGETIEPIPNITTKKQDLIKDLKDDAIGIMALHKESNGDAIKLFVAVGGGQRCRKKISDIYIF